MIRRSFTLLHPLTQRPTGNSLIPLNTATRHFSSTGTPKEEISYEEKAKQQWRDYHKWRRHFTWSREQIIHTLRDYALWSTLGLLAYYNLTKRQQWQEYEAETFVVMDRALGRIHKLDPHNRLLEGTVWDKPVVTKDKLRRQNSDTPEAYTPSPGPTAGNGGKPVFF
ncbi:hypothetical protein GGF37_005400 [Kickxella alabastrina]|nr:hypothetical protein GGF37_005400 [Kickxella alabastrina]